MSDGPYKCDECGSTDAVQVTTQHETINADENGEPENINIESAEVNYADCAECGNRLIE